MIGDRAWGGGELISAFSEISSPPPLVCLFPVGQAGRLSGAETFRQSLPTNWVIYFLEFPTAKIALAR
ncbi:MAG: hypothetical protein F6J93_25480 [Oscillatoria sp. SIO1A7]|nr:hypothetical protein [Oscillatoria sp. SIO1A7]